MEEYCNICGNALTIDEVRINSDYSAKTCMACVDRELRKIEDEMLCSEIDKRFKEMNTP